MCKSFYNSISLISQISAGSKVQGKYFLEEINRYLQNLIQTRFRNY